jgi:pyruvate dehydrogenase E2 component (dihydrolipoamide acetyltransferase)
MAVAVTVPRLGWNMDEGVFVGWLKADGEAVRAGEPLFALEGEKATQEVEALDDGTLHIPPDAPRPGDRVPVGAVVGYLVRAGEMVDGSTLSPREGVAAQPPGEGHRTIPGPARASSPAAASSPLSPREGVAAQPPGEGGCMPGEPAECKPAGRATSLTRPLRGHPLPGGEGSETRPRSSPLARRVARELGIDWTQLRGAGRTGRVRKADVLAAAQQRRVHVPLSPTRRVIADRLALSQRTAVPVTITTTVEVTNLVSLREQFKVSGGDVPSYTDFFIKLAALALREHQMLNARLEGDHLVVSESVHIGIAVDTEAGLLVPVVHDADRLGLRALADRSRTLIDRARRGTIGPAEMQGGTFTVTNLGAFGIEAFTPVINPPQCAILGVGRIARRPAMRGDQVVGRDEMVLSLTFDHRIVDGAPAARFLQRLAAMIENPGPWLVS